MLDGLWQLSPTLRVTLVLATVEGLPYRKIAELLEIPEGTVAWRVNEARALLGIQRLEMYPQINIQGRVGHSEGADSLLTGVGSNELGFLGVTLNWELDLWGRLRRLNESARAALLASEEGRRGVILIVVSEVAWSSLRRGSWLTTATS